MAEPERVEINGRALRCQHCGGETFFAREILMNTRGLTFLNLDWLNQSAATYECSGCGFIAWFRTDAGRVSATEEVKPEQVTEKEVLAAAAQPADCVECGATIPAGATRCPECGWSYLPSS